MREAYSNLKKKFDLPEYDVLDREFEISSIENENFLLRSVKQNIQDRMEAVLEMLTVILQPDAGSFVQLCECHCFNDAEKKQVFEIYKRVMVLYRELTEADILLDDRNDAAVITRCAKEWPEIRKAVAPFVRKMKECWQKPTTTKVFLEYLG